MPTFVPITYSDGAPVMQTGGQVQRVACAHLAEWLVWYDRLQVARGRGHVIFYQAQGEAKASGDTHKCGSAWDQKWISDAAIMDAREMGAAQWHRIPGRNGWSSSGADHNHGLIRCGDNACNGYQYTAWLGGWNGLGLGGQGAGDPIIRPTKIRTWLEGIAWAKSEIARLNGTATTEDDMGFKTINVSPTGAAPAQQVLVSWDGLVGVCEGEEYACVKVLANAAEGALINARQRDVALAWRTRISGVAALLAHDDPAAIAASIVASLGNDFARQVAEQLTITVKGA